MREKKRWTKSKRTGYRLLAWIVLVMLSLVLVACNSLNTAITDTIQIGQENEIGSASLRLITGEVPPLLPVPRTGWRSI